MDADAGQHDDDDDDDCFASCSPEFESAFPLQASNANYRDALDEVHTRFVLNLPDSELQTSDRIMFQLEQAWWFYEDMIADKRQEEEEQEQVPADQRLPRFTTFKPFAEQLFCYSPLLPPRNKFAQMWTEFSKYKRKISNYGCILLNPDCSKIVLCRLWNSSTHTLPAGKINQGENGMSAAARETYEETGFDPLLQFGLTSQWKQDDPERVTWKPLSEQDTLVFQEDAAKGNKRRTAYVCWPVPEDFPFEPVARKEISDVSWHPVDDIPRRSYAVTPFLHDLKKWIRKRARTKGQQGGKGNRKKTPNRSSRGRATPGRSSRGRAAAASSGSSRGGSRGRGAPAVVADGDDLVASGLAAAGESSGWSEEDMFKVNEQMLGRKVEYDGSPYVFSEQGFAGNDPHAFRIVEGGFLNSTVQGLAPQPDASKLQPLFRKADDDGKGTGGGDADLHLTPFFTDDGATPWGEVVSDVKGSTPSSPARKAAAPAARSSVAGKKTNKGKKKQQEEQPEAAAAVNPGQLLLQQLHKQAAAQGGGGGAVGTAETTAAAIVGGGDAEFDSLFLTDKEITAKSQAVKVGAVGTAAKGAAVEVAPPTEPNSAAVPPPPPQAAAAAPATSAVAAAKKRREQLLAQYERDTEAIRQWVAKLPRPGPTRLFGEFRLDADAIMEKAFRSVEESKQQS